MPRYVIGIDLGTTNCALAYADLELEAPEVHTFDILQLVGAGTTEARATLPSFHYHAAEAELAEAALDLPWAADRKFAVGAWARDHGAETADRLISSAKSWLCHSGVDRRAAILPFEAEDDDLDFDRLSPIEVSRRFLEHLRQAWDASDIGAEHPLAEQELYLTVPASFDAVARELTVEAAREAGLKDLVLLEEPLAAFYAWLHLRGEDWRKDLAVGDTVLVCDVGGGTTDFSLIEAKDHDGDLSLERVAVGEHILLGGDNMDLALAQLVAQKLKAKKKKLKLDPWQSRALWYQCREAKERLLTEPDLDEAPITLLSRGSKLIGKTLKSTLTREDVTQVLVDGFFPIVGPDERPLTASKGGLRQLGLPYAKDAAISKHIAAFLEDPDDDGLRLPTALLVNGGVFKGTALRERLQELLGGWAEGAKVAPPALLESQHLDLAVATGAAHYGLVRRGDGIRVKGGVARSYYIGIERNVPAVPGFDPPLRGLCVVPFGMEYGTRSEVPGKDFGLIVGEPVSFNLYSSVTRPEDVIGEEVEDDELEATAPLEVTLDDPDSEPGATVKVRITTEVTEVGTLDIRCVAADGRRDWKLSFNIREHEET